MNSISKSMSFGGTSSSGGGLFGSNNNTTSNATTGANLFGSNSGTTNTASAGTLFGAPAAASTSTGSSGLFGASTDKRARSGSLVTGGSNTSLFGGSTVANSAAPAGSGLFGSAAPSNTTPAGTGLFGSSTVNNAAPSTGGSLFGNSTTAGTTGGGVFGSSTGAAQTTNTFGAGSSLFGSNAAKPAAPGPFGNASGATLQRAQQYLHMPPQSAYQQQQQQQQNQQQQQQQKLSEAEELSKQFMMIKECWDPNSPNFQFRHYFYNVCEPGQGHLYQCPPNTDPRLWEQAQQDNPDPSSLVPVVASGFDDLRKRVDTQTLQQQSYQERVTEISDKLHTILQNHHSGTAVRLADCRRRQADLAQRLLEFMKCLQVLRQGEMQLTAEEVVLKERIAHLDNELSKTGSVKQRLAELQDHTYRLLASARRRREMLGITDGDAVGDGYEVADEAQLESVLHMLAEKQRGLTQLIQVASRDQQALDDIEAAIEARHEEILKQQVVQNGARLARPQYTPW